MARAQKSPSKDILPHSKYAHAMWQLTSQGVTRNNAIVWLYGNPSITDDGPLSGFFSLRPADPVSIAEYMRWLQVFVCAPFESRTTAVQALLQGRQMYEESSNTDFIQDRVSGMTQSPNLLARIVRGAQRHIAAFNFNLVFSFTNALVSGQPQNPMNPLTIHSAADILSSTLLTHAVRQGLLTRVEAENRTAELRQQLVTFITDGRPLNVNNAALTRGDLVRTLYELLRYSSNTNDLLISEAELWFYRIKQQP